MSPLKSMLNDRLARIIFRLGGKEYLTHFHFKYVIAVNFLTYTYFLIVTTQIIMK